jgi:hypothetical protein
LEEGGLFNGQVKKAPGRGEKKSEVKLREIKDCTPRQLMHWDHEPATAGGRRMLAGICYYEHLNLREVAGGS